MGAFITRFLTYICMLIGSIALMGLPEWLLLKDLILEFIYLSDLNIKFFIYDWDRWCFINSHLFFKTNYPCISRIITDEKVFAHIHESPLIIF